MGGRSRVEYQRPSSRGWRGFRKQKGGREKGRKRKGGGRRKKEEKEAEEKGRWRPITGERVSRNRLKRI